MRTPSVCLLAAALIICLRASRASGQSPLSGEPIHVAHASARIAIDGDLSDEGWHGATRVEQWYEINPGDNTEPKVKNVGYLAYDDRFFYAGFEFDDPNPGYTRTITAPRWGARATGKAAGIGYTVLVADDAGGGSVITPGANGSDFAPQDFSSRVVVARARREIGRSFVSMLLTFSGSALFTYKLNWQSVLFVGYGDDRELSDLNRLEKSDRQFFVKISYAFQR